MSLSTVQQVLARIYTDSKLRDDFLTNPDVVGISFGLNCQEIQQLSKLSRQQVDLFARSLKRKRLGEIRKLLPLTNQALGKEFNPLFFQYSETYLPTGNKKHLLDAIAFTKFLLQQLTTDNTQPVSVLDVLRYEAVRLKMFEGKRLLFCNRFYYHLETLINSLHSDSPLIPYPQPNIGIWFRLPNSQWRSLFIPFSVKRKKIFSFHRLVQKYLAIQ
ncbi:conserved hypothetical protein [Hyella patelloides LEGE 07179]|uniref:SCO6045-like C-terminal domain-containing protein n=1 Tax=Hyella patelloides LEGE 07179 TaxID=945734 RepID=A0A563VIQ6_9CYAN|nr:hypothetical protein [Hyella patelloides]VEP11310.1 conserved hypothetical protein [Hyella patelloides LEGE 07179]